MTFVESNWTYDKLGRVADQVVQKGPGPVQVVRQDPAYFGNDDPKSLTHYLGTTAKQFLYSFDLRHQVTGVTTYGAPGYFDATYELDEAGRFARTTEASSLPPGSDVKPRDVEYLYEGSDPEQVTALVHASGLEVGTNFASYTYDAAGNQLARCYSAISVPVCQGDAMEYVYDGKDQLRRATKKVNGVVAGSEEYWYDHAGQRVAIVKRDANGTKTEMIWFIGDVQAHYDGAGNPTHIYSHLSLGTPVARVDRTGGAGATTLEYQFHGLASNTIAAVAHDGTINASFSYAPFGEVIEATDAGAPSAGVAAHVRRPNDKYEDDLSALAYYGARYYDKTLIGWTQADPLYLRVPDAAQMSTPRRANIYQFSLNNPLRYLDPDGLDPSSKPPDSRDGEGMCKKADGGGCTMETGSAVTDSAWADAAMAQAQAFAEELVVQNEVAAAQTELEKSAAESAQPQSFSSGEFAITMLVRIPLFFLMLDDRPPGDRNKDTAQSQGSGGAPVTGPMVAPPSKKVRGGTGAVAKQTRKQLLASRASFEKRIAEHRKKLSDYRANPDAHDNRGVLKGASAQLREKIIAGRIKVLERTIQKHEGELKKVNELLGNTP
jgi:RHS repeat-associated protein